MADAKDIDRDTLKSPIARAKQWVGNIGNMFIAVPSPRFRAQTFSDNKEKSGRIQSSAGYKSAPGRIVFGQDFPHLKRLRDVCQNTIGGDYNKSHSSVSDVYASLYGALDDLKAADESRFDEDDTKETMCLNNQTGSYPDQINNLCTSSTLYPVHWRSYIDVSTGNLEACMYDKTSPGLQKRCNSTKSDKSSLVSSKAKEQPTLGIPRKQSFDNLISYHTQEDRNIEAEETKAPAAYCTSHDETCRIKLGLQYFKNTRQLRVLLLTVVLLRARNCKIFVKLSLLGNSSKQKVMSRRIHCNSPTVELNEVVYLEQQNGRTNEKLLRIRLCKESRFVRRVKSIGEAIIALDDLDLSSDTSMWLLLRKRKSQGMVSPQYELVSESECSKEDTRVPLLLDKSLADSDIKLLLESTRSHFHGKESGRTGSLEKVAFLPEGDPNDLNWNENMAEK